MKKFPTLLALFLVTLSFATANTLDHINVDGKRGSDGQSGYDASGTASGAGSDGDRGGNGADGADGQDAGNIELSIRSELKVGKAIPANAVIEGFIDTPKGGSQDISNTIKVGNSGYILLSASGGRGGDGGAGGHGEDGAIGYDGMPATEHSNGTDGGDGGRGGDGGHGGDGGNGGRGGAIELRFSEKDTHLLMLVNYDIEGGSRGRGGKGGNAGQGGQGGDGGASHTWYETEHYVEIEKYTDANGQIKTREVPKTRQVPRTNPGGHDGSAGAPGISGDNGDDGNRGNQGRYRIRVGHENGKVETYRSRYDLKLLGFSFVSDNSDGIFEPGEEVTVRNIRIQNTGGMPTPAFHDAIIFLQSNRQVISQGLKISVSKSLKPGESYQVPGTLKFKMRDNNDIGHNKRFSAIGSVDPAALMSTVNRPFTTFRNSKSFEITYPIEITPVQMMESLGPGQQTRVLFEVKNISSQAFGSLSDLKREISVKFQQEGGELQSGHLEIVGADGTKSIRSGFVQAIENLGPGKSVLVEGIVTIKEGAPLYSKADLRAHLKLGEIDKPSETRPIQRNDFVIRVAQTYSKTPGSEVLLVTNHSTDRKEIEQWKKMLNQIGLKVDVWDISLNGFFRMADTLKSHSSLLEDFTDGTIILLNNQFEAVAAGSPNAEFARGHYFLKKKELYEAVSNRGIHFYVVGGGRAGHQKMFEELLIPTETEEVNRFESVKNFFKRLFTHRDAKNADSQELDVLLGEKMITDMVIPSEVIETQSNVFWRKAKDSDLEEVAGDVQERLEKLHPDRRYVIVRKFEPHQIGRGGFFWLKKRWDLGELTVYRTLDGSNGSAVALSVDDNPNTIDNPGNMHNPRFVSSLENHVGLFMAMSFGQNLNLLNDVINYELKVLDGEIYDLPVDKPSINRETAEALIDAILISIADEQKAMRKYSWRSGLSKDAIREKLTQLKALSEYSFDPLVEIDDPNVKRDAGEYVVKLVAGIKFLLKRTTRWYDYLLPFRRDRMIKSVSEDYFDDFVDNVFPTKEKRKKAMRLVDKEFERLNSEWKKLVRSSRLGKKKAAVQLLLNPPNRKGMTIDTQAADTESRILDGEDITELKIVEADRERTRQRLEDSKKKEKSKLDAANCEAKLTGKSA